MNLNEVTVECGNGGDYEYERDRYYWKQFIVQKVPGCSEKDFNIIPHSLAHLGIVVFDDVHHATIFRLIKPEYISYSLVD